ncbi:MAG: phosphonoacetaldehyde reductase [Bacteroidales bacterium]|jgi:alcohol dehydrogenase class IV|nr:phosphonoacetaldehyde reductase [Bacteroidales bacterium]
MPEKQISYIGSKSIFKLTSLLQNKGYKNVFLVRAKKSFELSGAKSLFDDLTDKLNLNIIEFFDFSENPKVEDLKIGLSLLSEKNIDLIIAVGGGSVIDMAKLIRFFYSYSGDFTGRDFQKEKNIIPLVAIPTTAGTGSEATHFAVLYKDKVKYSVAHKDILPDYAIIYPPLTYSTPKNLTATTGFDALAQAIEAYWNVNATDESDEYAVKAIKLLWQNLPEVVNNPTDRIRNKVSEGAYWAGKAINITKTTAPHALSYAFTSYYNIPHGNAVALTFPFFMKYNLIIPQDEYCGVISLEKYNLKMKYLMNLLEIKSEDEIYDKFNDYITKLQLSTDSHKNVNIDIIINNVNIERANNNPRKITRHSLKNLLVC